MLVSNLIQFLGPTANTANSTYCIRIGARHLSALEEMLRTKKVSMPTDKKQWVKETTNKRRDSTTVVVKESVYITLEYPCHSVDIAQLVKFLSDHQ